jgi:hypothetical protein
VATVVLIVVAIVALGSLWADLDELDIVDRALDGERVTLREAQDADDISAGVGLGYTVVFLVSIITFLLWYSRAYRNTIALGLRDPRWGTRWAVWYWFIPIVALFRPKQVINDVWRASDPRLQRPAPAGWLDLPVSPLIHWWWAAWLLATVGDQIAVRATFANRDSPSLDDLHRETVAYVASDVVDVAAAILAILAIRALTRRLEERRRRAEAGELLEGGALPPVPAPG